MRGSRPALALLLAALMVASVLAPAALAQQPGGADPADAVYVSGDGDAVLVHEEARSPGDTSEGQFGADVDENLVYGLVTDSVDEAPDVRGNFSMRAEPTLLTANGSLSAPQPDAVRSLDLSISSEATPENSRADVDLSGTFADEGFLALLQSASTDGEITIGPDRLQASGQFDASSTLPVGEESSFAMSLSEGENSYTISVDRDQRISTFQVDQWRDRETAEQTIRQQFALDSTGMPGSGGSAPSVEVSLDEYSLTEQQGNSARLDVSYTVNYRNADQLLRQLIVSSMATNPQVSSSQAEELANEFLAVEINEASVSYEAGSGSYAGDFALDVSDYDGLLLAYFDVVESAGAAGAPAGFQQAREQFEAQRAADMQQEITWNGELAGESDGKSVDLGIQVRTTNWQDYVQELRDRDVAWHESEFELTGSADGDRLSFDGSLTFEGEQLFEAMFGQFEGGGATPEATQALASLAESQPQQVKLDSSYDADGLRLEIGAEFGNLAALRDAIAEQSAGSLAGSVTEVAVRSDDDGDRTYVHVDGAVSGDAAESDVRALDSVGPNTEVHMPGDWDEDFPRMDADAARAFLDGTSDTDGGFGPGFGVVVAVVALLAAALYAARRRRGQ